MVRCLIGFGSNRGDSQSLFEQTIQRLQQHPAVQNLVWAPPLRTRAVLGCDRNSSAETDDGENNAGESGDEDEAAAEYLNSVIRLDTELEVESLFELTTKIEVALGRVREKRWDSRTVDLDLLLFGDLVMKTRTLSVPHPRMSFRKFVLTSAIEIAGDMIHPIIGLTLGELWSRIESAPARVLWLTDNRDDADQVAEDLFSAEAENSGWQITVKEIADQSFLNDRLDPREFALVVVSGQFDMFCELAAWFAGPALHLTVSPDFLERELRAAIESLSS